MNYLYFCISFMFCAIVCCLTFLFCVRILYLYKTEKIDPVNVVKTQKQITAKKRIDRSDALNALLENG